MFVLFKLFAMMKKMYDKNCIGVYGQQGHLRLESPRSQSRGNFWHEYVS